MKPTRILLSAVVLWLGAAALAPAADIVAHRGASWDAPENTMAAFELAWEQDADAIECDVFLTGDGRIIVIHDATTRRTTGIDWRVDERTLEELQTLDAGAWKGEQWKGERLPTLSEVLAIVPPGKRIFIEIKCGPEIMPELHRVLAAAPTSAAQLVIISFHEPVIRAVKRELPELPAYWLYAFKRDEETGQWTATHEQIVDRAVRMKADGLSLRANEMVNAELVSMIREAGLEFHVWTVNDPAVARHMAALGVDSITTDRPAFIRDELARTSAAHKARAAELTPTGVED